MSRPPDLEPFSRLLTQKPELAATFSHNLTTYYEPLAEELIGRRQQKGTRAPLWWGVAANQGAGKTTLSEVYEILFATKDLVMYPFSIDSGYLTHAERQALRARGGVYEGFEHRAVTHDHPLIDYSINSVMNMGDEPILLPGPFAKGAHKGDGDRFRWITPQAGLDLQARVLEDEIMINGQMQKAPVLRLDSATFKGQPLRFPDGINMGALIPLVPGFIPDSGEDLRQFLLRYVDSGHDLNISVKNVQGKEVVHFETKDKSGHDQEHDAAFSDLPPGWRVLEGEVDLVFFEGWMEGLYPVQDRSVFNPGLLRLPGFRNMADVMFAQFINDHELPKHLQYSDIVDYQSVLYNPNYQISLKWREQQEQRLRKDGQGMSPEKVIDFVHYFWRSLHPTLFLDKLARNPERVNQVTVIDDYRRILSVTEPEKLDEVLQSLKDHPAVI